METIYLASWRAVHFMDAILAVLPKHNHEFDSVGCRVLLSYLLWCGVLFSDVRISAAHSGVLYVCSSPCRFYIYSIALCGWWMVALNRRRWSVSRLQRQCLGVPCMFHIHEKKKLKIETGKWNAETLNLNSIFHPFKSSQSSHARTHTRTNTHAPYIRIIMLCDSHVTLIICLSHWLPFFGLLVHSDRFIYGTRAVEKTCCQPDYVPNFDFCFATLITILESMLLDNWRKCLSLHFETLPSLCYHLSISRNIYDRIFMSSSSHTACKSQPAKTIAFASKYAHHRWFTRRTAYYHHIDVSALRRNALSHFNVCIAYEIQTDTPHNLFEMVRFYFRHHTIIPVNAGHFRWLQTS